MTNSDSKPDCTIIACPVFKGLLETVLLELPNAVIQYMPEDIHNNALSLDIHLRKNLQSTSGKKVILAGAGCHCKTPIPQIAKTNESRYSSGQNCFEILLGVEKTKALLKSKTGIITKNWMAMIQNAIVDGRYSRDDARIDFGYFEKVLLVDTDLSQLNDEDILEFFDIVQVPIEMEEIDLNHFQAEILRLIQ